MCYNEITMKEIIDFKYLDQGKDSFHNVRHSHGNSYEFVLVCKGSGSFIVRDKLFPIRPLSLYLINGIETHCSVPDEPTEYTRRKLIVDARFIDALAQDADCTQSIDALFKKNGGTYLSLDKETAAAIDAQFFALNEALKENSPLTKMKAATAMMTILVHTEGHAQWEPSGQTSPYLDNRIVSALDFIHSNLQNNITLDEICLHVCLSKSHLCHTFKKTVGMSVFEYILSRRLSNAKKYLLTTSTPVSKIATDVGFSDFSYFSKIFKEREGISPSRFRAEHL